MSENRRSKLLINPGFQLKILTYVTILNIFVLSVFELIHVYYFNHLRSIATQAGLSQDHIFFQFLDSIKGEMTLIFIFACAAMVVIVYGLGFYISNRIAGPVYNITKSIERIRQGETVEEIKFRENDFFPELANSVNELITHYKKAKK